MLLLTTKKFNSTFCRFRAAMVSHFCVDISRGGICNGITHYRIILVTSSSCRSKRKCRTYKHQRSFDKLDHYACWFVSLRHPFSVIALLSCFNFWCCLWPVYIDFALGWLQFRNLSRFGLDYWNRIRDWFSFRISFCCRAINPLYRFWFVSFKAVYCSKMSCQQRHFIIT